MKRPHMGLATKLAACLIQMGYHPADAARAAGIRLPKAPEGALAWSAAAMDERARARIDFDHCPALALRMVRAGNIETGPSEWTPRANDPRFIQPLGFPLHGPKSIADTKAAAKVKRIVKKAVGKVPEGFETIDGQPCVVFRTPLGKSVYPLGKPKVKRAWPKGRKIATRAK